MIEDNDLKPGELKNWIRTAGYTQTTLARKLKIEYRTFCRAVDCMVPTSANWPLRIRIIKAVRPEEGAS